MSYPVPGTGIYGTLVHITEYYNVLTHTQSFFFGKERERDERRSARREMRTARSNAEKMGWVLVTAVTNLLAVPFLFRRSVLLKRHFAFEAVLSAFTIATSFMYHLCDSLQYYGSRGIGLGEGAWHRLDNVGSILCFVVLIIHFTDYADELHAQVNKFCMLWLVVLAQEYAPWDLRFTVGPIALQVAIFIVKRVVVDRGTLPPIDPYMAKRAAALQGAAFVFFYLGLNEHEDPMRICHGLWHTFSAVASQFHWRVVYSAREGGRAGKKINAARNKSVGNLA